MALLRYTVIALVLCAAASATQPEAVSSADNTIEDVPVAAQVEHEAPSLAETPAEHRTIEAGQTLQLIEPKNKQTYQQTQVFSQPTSYQRQTQHPVYHPGAPVYQPHRRPPVQPYQQPQHLGQQLSQQQAKQPPHTQGGHTQGGQAPVAPLPSHPKPAVHKKPTDIKDMKPNYYPKESSYSVVPQQPGVPSPHSPRFVADPSRQQQIEEFTPQQLHQMTVYQQQPQQPQQYALLQQQQQMPGYDFNYAAAVPGAPHLGGAQQDASLVTYEQTDHGFMDRVWGEVQTVRETITTDFFGAIPRFLRNVWDAIVSAVSTTSARMFESINWFEALQLVLKQLS